MRRLGLAFFVLALSTICALGADGDKKSRLWKVVPGYPTLFVDMNSIQPMNTEKVCHNPPFIPLDTIVDGRRNGRRESL